MSDLANRLQSVQQAARDACLRAGRDPQAVTLIAVSKQATMAEALALRELGVEDFGENRLNEGLRKVEALDPARVHFIGHLQANKVNRVVGRFVSIHSLDRAELIEAVARRAADIGIVQAGFLQVNVTGEASKGGVAPQQVAALLREFRGRGALQIQGLMTMAPLGADESLLRAVFSQLQRLAAENGLAGLSMGMSQDFAIAIEEGATHIRVGSRIFCG